MVLTKHQIRHLDAVINDCDTALVSQDKIKLAKNKKVVAGKEDEYFLKVKDDADKIKKSGKFPEIEESEIHDYLEKGRTEFE